MIMAKNARGMTALSCAATNGDLEIMFSVMDVMSKFLSRSQVGNVLSPRMRTERIAQIDAAMVRVNLGRARLRG